MTGDMRGDYWDGAVWVYHAKIVNNGTNSGSHEYDVIPGAGNELEILYGNILNGDTSNRTGYIWIYDEDENIIGQMQGVTDAIVAGKRISFPRALAETTHTEVGSGGRWIVAGTMKFHCQIDAIAVNQDSEMGVACRIRGGLPTVTLTSPTGATETVNKNVVY